MCFSYSPTVNIFNQLSKTSKSVIRAVLPETIPAHHGPKQKVLGKQVFFVVCCCLLLFVVVFALRERQFCEVYQTLKRTEGILV